MFAPLRLACHAIAHSLNCGSVPEPIAARRQRAQYMHSCVYTKKRDRQTDRDRHTRPQRHGHTQTRTHTDMDTQRRTHRDGNTASRDRQISHTDSMPTSKHTRQGDVSSRHSVIILLAFHFGPAGSMPTISEGEARQLGNKGKQTDRQTETGKL
mmetsp:Transcript_22980/g.65764  ORF Transcript_22980/g.65764 Transcript_22980/m.65764 type:complete len:154 (-) Transcript_22980:1463-1924(-)